MTNHLIQIGNKIALTQEGKVHSIREDFNKNFRVQSFAHYTLSTVIDGSRVFTSTIGDFTKVQERFIKHCDNKERLTYTYLYNNLIDKVYKALVTESINNLLNCNHE
jgi:short subunit dehydrogenase-like uncharacterized protein